MSEKRAFFDISIGGSPAGRIIFSLFDDLPITTENFAQLCLDKKLQNSIFHRVINNFMIQGYLTNCLPISQRR